MDLVRVLSNIAWYGVLLVRPLSNKVARKWHETDFRELCTAFEANKYGI